MTRFHTSRIIPVAVLALAAGLPAATAVAAPAAAATTYTITDLGSLGLGVSDGLAINANGQVRATHSCPSRFRSAARPASTVSRRSVISTPTTRSCTATAP